MKGQINGWWDAVLAGEVDTPHPVHGDQLRVRLRDGRLVLSGQLDKKRERDELVRQARSHVGKGLRAVDASGLKVRAKYETLGVLDQTLLSAFDHRDTAELVRDYVLEHSEVKPKQVEIVDKSTQNLRSLLPPETLEDAKKILSRGQALLVLRVDEAEAFKVRSLLEEDTRSTWTLAAPPQVARSRHG